MQKLVNPRRRPTGPRSLARRDPDRPSEAPPVRMPVVDVGGNQMDVISRLLKDRILLLGQQVRCCGKGGRPTGWLGGFAPSCACFLSLSLRAVLVAAELPMQSFQKWFRGRGGGCYPVSMLVCKTCPPRCCRRRQHDVDVGVGAKFVRLHVGERRGGERAGGAAAVPR